MTPQREPTLLQDPVYYVMLVVFAVLTTVLPALLRQPWMLPFGQTIALTVFVAIAARQGSVRHGVIVMTLFLFLQFVLIFTLTLLAERRLEVAISGGFLLRTAMAEWAYGGGTLPASWSSQPLANLAAFVALTGGAYLTGGLAGVWVLARAVNMAAFSAASFLLLPGDPAGLLIGLAPWTLLKVGGGIALVAVLAQALWRNLWSPRLLVQQHGRTLFLGAVMLVASVLVEFAFVGLWQSFFIDPY